MHSYFSSRDKLLLQWKNSYIDHLVYESYKHVYFNYFNSISLPMYSKYLLQILSKKKKKIYIKFKNFITSINMDNIFTKDDKLYLFTCNVSIEVYKFLQFSGNFPFFA